MLMPTLRIVVTVAVAAVSAALGLERSLHLHKIRSETLEHILDHVIWSNAEDLVPKFRRQMPIAQMPSKTHKLIGILMPDFKNKLRGGLNLEPPPIFKLQAISIGHRNRFRKIEKDILPLIPSQANTAAMARVKIESERTCRFFLRPISGGAMN